MQTPFDELKMQPRTESTESHPLVSIISLYFLLYFLLLVTMVMLPPSNLVPKLVFLGRQQILFHSLVQGVNDAIKLIY